MTYLNKMKGYTVLMYRLGTLVVCIFFFPAISQAATLYINPTQGTYGPGDTFIAEVRLNTEGECFNAADVTVNFPNTSLKAVDFSRGDSLLSLFVEEPKIHQDLGTVTFIGGVPGGYCGRIQGDPAISNVLGKIVFTVLGGTSQKVTLGFSVSTALYLNDGQGTKVIPKYEAGQYTLVSTPQLSENAWLSEVKQDTTPPDPFVVQIESTRGVFSGNYYAVFSTLDKQSGIDHFEIFEKGAWGLVTSPHELKHPSFLDGLQVRAIDKAGNIRLGEYTATSVPKLQAEGEMTPLLIFVALFIFALGAKLFLDWRKRRESPPLA